MAKGKLEETSDLRFGVRLGISYDHALVLSGSRNGNGARDVMEKKRNDFELRDDRGRGSKRRRLLCLQ